MKPDVALVDAYTGTSVAGIISFNISILFVGLRKLAPGLLNE